MNKNILIKVIEYTWIGMALFCLIMGIVYQSKIGIDKAWLFYGFAAMSLGMFFMRRMQRRNNEKRQNRFK
jgi:hypothetical protein